MRPLIVAIAIIGLYMLALHFWGDQYSFQPDLSGLPTEEANIDARGQTIDAAKRIQAQPKGEPVEQEPLHYVEY